MYTVSVINACYESILHEIFTVVLNGGCLGSTLQMYMYVLRTFLLFTFRYQQLLHRNLVYLATLADSTQSMQNTIPVSGLTQPSQNVPLTGNLKPLHLFYSPLLD